MKKKLKIYASEARVLQILYYSPRSLTTNEVADKAGVAWATADKYIQKWKEKGLINKKLLKYSSISKGKKLNKETWSIDKELVKSMF